MEPDKPAQELIAETKVPEETPPVTPEASIQPEPLAAAPFVAAPKKKLSKKLVLIIAAVVLVVAGAAAWMLMRKEDPNKTSTSTSQAEKRFGVAVGLLEGTAQYSSDLTTWRDLTADTDLSEGHSVRTAASSRVVLLIDDGSAVRLDADTTVTLTDLSVTNVVVTNTAGEVYSRVVASDSRAYTVKVGDELYKAKGTAYRTFNEAAKKGVEVYQSTVSAEKAKTDVAEGTYLYSQTDQKDKEGKVLALDIQALKTDDFLKWNSDQDKKVATYADKLGVLTELDKPAPTPPATPSTTTTSSSGITLSGKQSEYSAVFSWKVSGVSTSKGYKLVRSKKTSTPTYPNDSVAYIEAGKTSYTLYVGDGLAYTYRLCAYRDNGCESYSNAVSVTTTKKEKATLQSGSVDLSINGSTASWTFGGTAPYGFKLLVGTSSGPTYDNSYKKYYTEGTSYELPGYDFSSGSTYYLKVCKYTDSGCTDYSDEVIYTP